MVNTRKGIKEKLAQFLENPKREDLRKILVSHLGETNSLDFKERWCEKSKMARHILAFANSGGGIILFGVTDDHENVGLEKYKDEADFKNQVQKYLPNRIISQDIQIINFDFGNTGYEEIQGDKFQVLIIEDDPECIPFVSEREGSSIDKNIIYTRKATSSEEASYEDLQNIISRRIKAGYSSSEELQGQLNQLETLYSNINRYNRYNILDRFTNTFNGSIIPDSKEENPYFPDECFDEFIARMIDGKKYKIEKILNLK